MGLCNLNEIRRLQISSVLRMKSSGHTQALEVICCNSSSMITCVLKPYSNLPLKTHTSARELIGAKLGSAFGLRVPEPFIVEVEPDTQSLVDNPEIKNRLATSIGDNFGCKHIDNCGNIANFIEKEHIEQAADIFAFDILLQNDDRRLDNPNMFQDADGYIEFDHEMAFPYSRPDLLLGGFPEPWDYNASNYMKYRDHFFYKGIKGKDIPFTNFGEKLADLQNHLPDIIISGLPKPWLGNEIDNIIDFLAKASTHSDTFVRSLKEMLG